MGGNPGQNEVGTREHKNAEDDVKVEGDSRRIPLPGGIEDPVGVRDNKRSAEENGAPRGTQAAAAPRCVSENVRF